MYLIYDKPGEPSVYLGTPQEVNGNLNELLPGAAVGTIVQISGGAVKKQKDPNGNWNKEGQMPMPNASFVATGKDTGTLNNVMSGMTYQIDSGAAVNITGSTVNLTSLAACTIKVVLKGTVDSDTQEITVTKETTPALTPVQPSVIGGKGSIPTTDAHQYSTDDSTWTNCTGPMENLDPGTYYIRLPQHGTVLASDSQTITITAYEGTPEETPTASFAWVDETSGTLSDLVDGAHYVASGAATADFTADGTTQALSDVEAGTLSLVRKGDGVHTTDSEAQEIEIEAQGE